MSSGHSPGANIYTPHPYPTHTDTKLLCEHRNKSSKWAHNGFTLWKGDFSAYRQFPKHSRWTSIRITSEPPRNANTQAHPRPQSLETTPRNQALIWSSRQFCACLSTTVLCDRKGTEDSKLWVWQEDTARSQAMGLSATYSWAWHLSRGFLLLAYKTVVSSNTYISWVSKSMKCSNAYKSSP